MLTMCTTIVSATTNAELPDQLMAIAEKYGATAADKIKIERYLSDYPVTEAEANDIVAKAKDAAAYMDSIGATSINQLTGEQKNVLKSKANAAAAVVGLTLSFKDNSVQVYKNGKLVEVVSASATTGTQNVTSTTGNSNSNTSTSTSKGVAKLVYTGSNAYIILTIAGIVTIALVIIAIIRKKVVNA